MKILSQNEVIDAIQEYTESFTLRVPNTTKDRWVSNLQELKPDDEILSRAIRRCAENDLSPAWSRLRSAITVERSIQAAKRFNRSQGDSRAFEEWVVQYRAEGSSQGFPPVSRDNDSPVTQYDTARYCYRVVNRILHGKTKVPYEPCAHGALFVDSCKTCAAFKRWFWSEVENLMHHDEYIAPVFADEL